MLIILEGADGAGKSTLARDVIAALQTAYPADEVELLHRGPPTSHPLDEYERPLFDYRPGTGRHVVCDRWHVGEFVYPGLLGRSSDGDVAVWQHLDMFLRSRGALLVHLDPPAREVVRNLKTRGDAVVRSDQVDELLTRYRTVIPRAALSTLRVPAIGDPLTVGRVIGAARGVENAATPLNEFVTYVGPPRPRYLLLGDVRHELRDVLQLFASAYDTVYAGPAFGPYRGTSGHYLLTHLPVDIWRQVGLANACDVDLPDRLYRTLGKPQTATLGVKARNRLRGLDVAAGSAPHPQYWRRFHNGHGAAYGSLLRRSLLTGDQVLSWRP